VAMPRLRRRFAFRARYIIVLVMIGISLANSVSKILSELPPVTKEQLQAATGAELDVSAV